MDYILPKYEVKELPSKFIPYPEDVKICVQPYRAGEAINIEMVGKNSLRFMEEILSGTIVEGLPKNMLTPQDILFLGVYRNLVSSRHDKIDMKSICPYCLNENHEVKTLSSIKFKDIEDFDKDCYPIEVEFDDYIMHFGFLTYKDFEFCMSKYKGYKLCQIALQVLDYRNKETGELITKPNYVLRSNKPNSLVAIDSYVKDLKEILYNFVDEDKDTLEEVVNILENFGLKPIETTCQDERCKHTYTFNIDDEEVLIMPFRDTEKSARARIKLSRKDFDRSDSIQADESERSMPTTRIDRKKTEIKTGAIKATDSVEQYQPLTNSNQV